MTLPLHVLIAEDSEDDALLLVRELKRGGYDPVFERVDTPEAMTASLQADTWDIVISDYVMPHFGGLDALKMLQDMDLDLPFIIVSGKIGEDVAVEAMKAGAHDYVVKGNLARLVPAIRRELGEAAVRRERKRVWRELNEQRELLRLVTDHIPQFIYWKDRNSVYMGCNKQLAREADGGTRLVCELPWHQSAIDMEREQRVIETDQPELHVVEQVVLNDGKQAWVDISRVPLHDDDGKVIGLLSLFEDITERKQAEEELVRRRERELQIHAEAEEAKRRFYRGTIASVTNGKLNLVSYDEVGDLLAPDAEEIAIARGEDLSAVRARAAQLARDSGMSQDDVYALTLAVGEATANVLKHVKEGTARVGFKEGKVQVCVQDHGPGIDALVLPQATLMKGFSTKPSMGLGYSLILASVDTVYLATDKQGTSVLMEKAAQNGHKEISIKDLPDNW